MTAAFPEQWTKNYLRTSVVLGTDLVPQNRVRATSFYQDILSTLGLEYLMAGVPLFGQDHRALIKFFRADGQENFSSNEAGGLAY